MSAPPPGEYPLLTEDTSGSDSADATVAVKRSSAPAWLHRAWFPGALTLVTLLGLAIRLPWLGAPWFGTRSLWRDEGYTVAIAQRPFLATLRLFAWEPSGILFNLIEWPIGHFTTAEAAVRLPAVCAGIIAIPATYWAGKELVGRRVGLIGAAFMAVVPIGVEYSRDARPYSLCVLTAAISMACLARAARINTSTSWLWYALATIAVIYSNTLGGLLMLIPNAVFIATSARSHWRRWVLWLVGIGIATIPLALLSMHAAGTHNALYWVPPIRIAAITSAFIDFFGESIAWRYFLIAAAVTVLIAAAARIGGAIGNGMAGSTQPRAVTRWITCVLDVPRLRGGSFGQWATITTWAVAPVLGLAAMSLISPVFVSRYALSALPGVALLVGAVLDSLPTLATVIAVVAIGLPMFNASTQNLHAPLEDFRDAMAFFNTVHQAGAPVIFNAAEALPVAGIYAPSLLGSRGMPMVTEYHDQTMPPGVAAFQPYGDYNEVPYEPPSLAFVQAQLQRAGSLIVVDSLDEGYILNSPGLAWTQSACQVNRQYFIGVEVALIDNCTQRP